MASDLQLWLAELRALKEQRWLKIERELLQDGVEALIRVRVNVALRAEAARRRLGSRALWAHLYEPGGLRM